MLRRLMAAVGMLEVEDGNYIDRILSPASKNARAL